MRDCYEKLKEKGDRMTLLQVLNSRAPRWSVSTAVIFAVVLVFVIWLFRQLKFSGKQRLAGAALYMLTFNSLVTTLLMRTQHDNFRYNLIPLYQLAEVLKGNQTAFWELVLNFFMLFHVGFLLPWLINHRKRFIASALIGSALSALIEVVQLATCLGELQIDDFIANSLGAFSGAVAACAVYMWFLDKRQKNL